MIDPSRYTTFIMYGHKKSTRLLTKSSAKLVHFFQMGNTFRSLCCILLLFAVFCAILRAPPPLSVSRDVILGLLRSFPRHSMQLSFLRIAPIANRSSLPPAFTFFSSISPASHAACFIVHFALMIKRALLRPFCRIVSGRPI